MTEKDSLDNVTKYAYDCMNRLVSMEDGIGRKTEYTYDAIGNVISEKSSNGTIEYKYDALDRLCEKNRCSWKQDNLSI